MSAAATVVAAAPASTTTPSAPSQPRHRQIRLLSRQQVALHNSADDCWVIHRGKVYNVTEFVQDHPGGDDLILRYAGTDMGDVMDDPVEHSHSDSAYELLAEYLVGRLPQTPQEEAKLAASSASAAGQKYAGEYSGKDDSIVITADFHPDETDGSADFQKHHFLDLSRPLIPQMWSATFNKQFYLEQVHNPRHLKQPARLFGPDVLEMFTRTPWYVVPVVWVPVAATIFYRAVTQFAVRNLAAHLERTAAGDSASPLDPSIWSVSVSQTLACWAVGVVIWTLLEYTLHRFLFHIDNMLPDRPLFLTLHFLLHGVHHYLPMDRLRLVMPPLLFFVLSYPFTQLAHVLFPQPVANGIISGSFSMYVVYDCMHFALHHTRLPQYLRDMKQYHLEHHYKNFELGFGVTSKVWDYVFGTLL
ncbi:fatty acid alpha-hydroxylase [Thecaphora frezii]